MCFDADSLPEEKRVLRGEYFTDNFRYFQIQLKPCVNKTEVTTTQKAWDQALADIAYLEKRYEIGKYEGKSNSLL